MYGVFEVALDGPHQLLLDTRRRRTPRHQACDALGMFAPYGDVQRMDAVPVERVGVGALVDEEVGEEGVAAGKSVVQRRPAAPVLTVVGITATTEKLSRDEQTRLAVLGRVLVAGGDLVEAAVEGELTGRICGRRGEQRASASAGGGARRRRLAAHRRANRGKRGLHRR